MEGEIFGLYKEYAGGGLSRREFLARLARLAGGTAAAAALLPRLEAAQAGGTPIVPAGDGRLETGYIKYPAADGQMRAYSARPKGGGKRPGVVVIHENRGLNPHTEDVARRVALEGYVAVAPDALSAFGGTPADPAEARPLFQKLERETTTGNFAAAVAYLKTHPQTTGKVACMGFCWGGAVTNQVAVHAPDLAAAVPFYGSQPAPEDVPKIKAAILAHYAGNDERINAGIPAFKEALEKAGVEHEFHMYPGTGHAFFNDTGGRYNKEAAELAWKRTLAFFEKKLKG
jgi:carboxymethylenebutenolidase